MQPSIAFRELEESFSFSNSSLLFSNPYDLCYSDDESYIEISLGHHHDHAQSSYNFKDDVEFRISFSSNTIPFPSLSVPGDSLITSTASPTDTTPCDPTPNSQRSINVDDETRMEFPRVLYRFVNAFMSSFALTRSSSQSPGPSNAFQLVRSRRRKASNMASINSGCIMKFLIKLGSLNTGRLVASLNKMAYQTQLKTSLRCPKLMKPFDKWLVGRTNDSEKSKTIIEMNMGGVLETMGLSVGGKDGKSKSSSPISSPIQHNMCLPDNSIQAAIAHCKTSFRPN